MIKFIRINEKWTCNSLEYNNRIIYIKLYKQNINLSENKESIIIYNEINNPLKQQLTKENYLDKSWRLYDD